MATKLKTKMSTGAKVAIGVGIGLLAIGLAFSFSGFMKCLKNNPNNAISTCMHEEIKNGPLW